MTSSTSPSTAETSIEMAKKLLSKSDKAFEGSQVHRLPGDASNRSYCRIQGKGQSRILMIMNAPEAFKSEEVTGSDETRIKELPFVTVAREFSKGSIRCPSVYHIGENSEFIVLEDLGDELLYDRRQKEPALSWYENAMVELAKIQRLKAFEPVKSRRFTRELLTWETEHFIEYALEKRNKKMNPAILENLRAFFKRVVETMESSTYTLVHRDYHSKNLLILEKENRVGIIDFQDALMGPPTYDLASLLRDSYITLSPHEEEHLIETFEKETKTKVDRKLYGFTSLQRNLKAVGRFYYISIVKGRDTHLPYVKPTMVKVLSLLKSMKELQIVSLLEGLLQEEIYG